MKQFVAAITIVGALMLPSVALAQGSSECKSYNPSTLCSPNVLARTTATAAANTNSSTLPFTGFDALLLAVGGATLLGAGAVIRIVSRRVE